MLEEDYKNLIKNESSINHGVTLDVNTLTLLFDDVTIVQVIDVDENDNRFWSLDSRTHNELVIEISRDKYYADTQVVNKVELMLTLQEHGKRRNIT